MPHFPLRKTHATSLPEGIGDIIQWLTGNAQEPEPEKPINLVYPVFRWVIKTVAAETGKNIRSTFNRLLREGAFDPSYFKVTGDLKEYQARLEKETNSLPTKTSTTALKDVPTAPLSTRTNKLRKGGTVKRKPRTRNLRKGGALLFGMKHGIKK